MCVLQAQQEQGVQFDALPQLPELAHALALLEMQLNLSSWIQIPGIVGQSCGGIHSRCPALENLLPVVPDTVDNEFPEIVLHLLEMLLLAPLWY